MVVCELGISAERLQAVEEECRRRGLQPQRLQSGSRYFITLAALANDHRLALEHWPGVERLVPTVNSFRPETDSAPLAAQQVVLRPEGGVLGGVRIGVIAGPCSVEDRAMLLETAHAVREAGAIGLRGGAFKPRTNPYSFQGLGEKALEFLAEAREQTGLAVVTEAMSVQQVELVARYADVVQIGARNMHNFVLLSAAGRCGKPVLLKRGWSATLEELLHAAEYIIAEGNPQVILCERGVRTFEQHVRNTLSLSIVPALKQHTPLPVIVDPSQGTGLRGLVNPMSKAALAAGADGLIIEVHPRPDAALTDAEQSVSLEQFGELMSELPALVTALGREMAITND